MERTNDTIHCLFIFTNQSEALLKVYDEYTFRTIILPYRNRNEDTSIDNILLQSFTPILTAQTVMLENLKTKFFKADLYNNKSIIIHKTYQCTMIVLLSEDCVYKNHSYLISKKLELMEWLISSFYGLCWTPMKYHNDKWLKTMLKELWLMDKMEFNLRFWSIERIEISTRHKLKERVFEVLMSNSRYLKQVNEKRLKHQLILAGSKLFCLYTTDGSRNLKAKHILLFSLICNALFNRYSRIREESRNEANNNVINNHKSPINSDNCFKHIPSKEYRNAITDVSSSSSDQDSRQAFTDISSSDSGNSSSNNQSLDKTIYARSFEPTSCSTSTTSPIGDLDPFVLWIENKDNCKYRIVRLFLNFSANQLTPCQIHLIKLARNVIYIGVEEDVSNSTLAANFDKVIRLLQTFLSNNEQNPKSDSNNNIFIKFRIIPLIEKLIYLGINQSQKLKQLIKMIPKDLHNSEVTYRLLKELLKTLETVYCQYYISNVVASEKTCKAFIRCFHSVKKEMNDFVSILSVKALRNLPPNSFYSLYPGLVHFVFVTRKIDKILISPVLDTDFLSDDDIQRLHFLLDVCRMIGNKMESNNEWKQIEIKDDKFRCWYLWEINNTQEIVVFHLAATTSGLVRKHISHLRTQFSTEARGQDSLL